MKRCPFCAEEIQDLAVKCRYCGEKLDQAESVPWYFSQTSLLLAFLCVGPLMLPLVWLHPQWSRDRKLGWTAVLGLLGVILVWATVRSLVRLSEYYRLLGEMGL